MNKRLVVIAMLMLCGTLAFSQPPLQQKLKFYVQMQLGLKIRTDKTAQLKEGSSTYEFLTVQSGKSYGIIAYSEEEDVRDVDIFIYDANTGELLERDETSRNHAILEFTAKKNQKLRIIVKNFDSKRRDTAYKCGYFIAH